MAFINKDADEYLESIGFEKKKFKYGGFGYCNTYKEDGNEIHVYVDPNMIRYITKIADGQHESLMQHQLPFYITPGELKSQLESVLDPLDLPESELDLP